MKRLYLWLWLAAMCALLVWAGRTRGQSPPGTGVYTFQGQGNLAQSLSGLINPPNNGIPFGIQGTYTVLPPLGDLTLTSPGNFQVLGGHFSTQVCSTTPCPVTATVVVCNAVSQPIVIQLPSTPGNGPFEWVIKEDGSTNACVITPSGGNTINGQGSYSITQQYFTSQLFGYLPAFWIASAPAPISGAGFSLLTTTLNASQWSINNVADLVLSGSSAPPIAVSATCPTGICSTTWTYEISCVTDTGFQSAPSPIGQALNTSALSGTNFNTLNWTPVVGCNGGYNVFGRTAGSLGFLANVRATNFVDNGTFPVLGVSPPAYGAIGAIVGNPVTLTNNIPSQTAVTIQAPASQSGFLLLGNVNGSEEFDIDAQGDMDLMGTMTVSGPVDANNGIVADGVTSTGATFLLGGANSVGTIENSGLGTPGPPKIVSGFTSGGTADFYWCVAQDADLFSTPVSVPTGTTNNIGTMSCGGMLGGITYSLLRTPTNTPPTGTANLLVGTCTTFSGGTCMIADNNNTLQAFTVQATDQTNAVRTPLLVANTANIGQFVAPVPATSGGTGVAAYPGPQLFQCTPGTSIAVTANTNTAICNGTTGALPAAPDASYLIKVQAMVNILMGGTTGACTIAAQMQNGATNIAGAASAGIATTVAGTVNAEEDATSALATSWTYQLHVQCTQSATVNVTDGTYSFPATVMNVVVTPR